MGLCLTLLSHIHILYLGYTAAYCTYTVQDLTTQAVVGLYVAQKTQVKSSSDMEPYAAKTILLNLANEHGLQTASLTTDRSSSVKTVIRSAL